MVAKSHVYIPQVPHELTRLDRAIMLLGERAKNLELRWNKQVELAQLLGRYPDVTMAAVWKSELKRRRAEAIVEPEGADAEATDAVG